MSEDTQLVDDEPFEEEDAATAPATPSAARVSVAIIVADGRRIMDVGLRAQEQADALGIYLQQKVQPAIKRVKEIFTDPKREARKALDTITKAEHDLLDPLELLKTDGKEAIDRYVAAARAAEQRIEQARIDQAINIANELRDNEARQLERQGESELAAEVRATPIVDAVPVVAAPPPPRVRGMSATERWTVSVESDDDFRELCRAVADGKVPIAALTFNATFAKQVATAAKGRLDWPGVKIASSFSTRMGRS